MDNIKKLDDNDLNQVSGGRTIARNASGFFTKNTLNVKCDYCGKQRKLEMTNIEEKFYTDGVEYTATQYWMCGTCGKTNKTYAEKGSDSDDWGGTTERVW